MTEGTRWQFVGFIAVLVVLYFLLRVGLGLGALAPDLLVVALLLAAREIRAGWAAGLGLLLGVVDGSMVPFNLGISALVLTALGFVGARSREIFSGESYVFLALYLFVGKWLYDAMLSLLTRELFRAGASEILVVAPMNAIYAAAAGVLAMAAYRAFT
jgi:cell shape-determining protein MreD